MSPYRKWSAIRQGDADPGRRERVAQYQQEMREEMTLAEMRRARDFTQVRLAESPE